MDIGGVLVSLKGIQPNEYVFLFENQGIVYLPG